MELPLSLHWTEVHEAARLGDTARIALLRDSPLIHARAADGALPLHIALLSGHLDACRLLIELGSPLDVALGEREPIELAAHHARFDLMALLEQHRVRWTPVASAEAYIALLRAKGIELWLAEHYGSDETLYQFTGRDSAEVFLVAELLAPPPELLSHEGTLDKDALSFGDEVEFKLDGPSTRHRNHWPARDASHVRLSPTPSPSLTLVRSLAGETVEPSELRDVLAWAAGLNLVELVQLLLDRGVDPIELGGRGTSALVTSCSAESTEALSALLKHAPLPGSHPSVAEALCATLSTGPKHNWKHLDLLLAAGARADSRPLNHRTTPLHAAVYQQDLEGLRRLLASNQKLEPKLNLELLADGKTPLCLAAGFATPEAVSLLLEAGANPNPDGDTLPLVEASRFNEPKVIPILINAGADPNRVTPFWGAPLMASNLSKHRDEMVRTLLACGANPELKNERGETALHRHAVYWNTGCIEQLLRVGAMALVRDSRGQTVLMAMVRSNHTGRGETLVQMLLKAGIDLNAQDDKGKTALFLALENHCWEAACYFVELGADTNLADQAGKRPGEWVADDHRKDWDALLARTQRSK
jgi:ankyrin repeat protein